MSFFKGIGGSHLPTESENIRPGTYLCYIREFIGKNSRASVPMAIFGMRVVAVLNTMDAEKAGMAPHRVGDTVSWVVNMTKDAAKPAIKLALKNITGVEEDQITDEFAEQLSSTAQPLAGMFVEVSARLIKTQKTGNPFTLVRFKRRWGAEEVNALEGIEAVLRHLKLDTSRAG